MGQLFLNINTVVCTENIMVMKTFSKEYVLLDENTGKEFMITTKNMLSWIVDTTFCRLPLLIFR